ncbi:cysteine proteinase [Cenococcum geophilum 1.58]|uniref:cysteine proteinase n=1 Tax=Cenococcum geophilum 1.58 TaxID=794803 RepID=UPI00358E1483|nr:cysteine proteinase [Cenococcum geophilum 1.58]
MCYRRSVMQAFLHLPQFMHWIKRHGNDPYPCRYANGPPSKNIKISPNCPACRMKRLIGIYWDRENTQNEVPRNAVRQFDQSLLNANNPVFPLSVNRQEDAGDFYRFLRDVFSSASIAQAWRNESDALFGMELRIQDVCGCGRLTLRPDPRFGLILPVGGKKDSIKKAIEKLFSPGTLDKRCESCATTVEHSSKALIESAPEILILQLIIYHSDGSKKRTDIHFDQWLDLKRFQRDQDENLQYKLSSVISHAGASVKSGHYISHVSGPQGFFVISDQDIRKSTLSAFTAPKQRHPGYRSTFDPYLLTYTRTES